MDHYVDGRAIQTIFLYLIVCFFFIIYYSNALRTVSSDKLNRLIE